MTSGSVLECAEFCFLLLDTQTNSAHSTHKKMTLTNVIGCIETEKNDVICLQQSPANPALALAGSSDNGLYVVDLRQMQVLFRI